MAPVEHRRRNVERSQMRTEVGVEHALETRCGDVRRGFLHLPDRPGMERRGGAGLEEVRGQLPHEGAKVLGDDRAHLRRPLRRRVRVLPVAEPARRRAHEPERAHALAEAPRELEDDKPAHRPADESQPWHAERAHEVLEVARHRADRVAGPWMRRLAVATQVDGDEREAVAERLDLPIPERPVAGPAMDQEDERARAHPVIAERDAGVREKWHPALVPWASRPRNMGWPIPVSAAGC